MTVAVVLVVLVCLVLGLGYLNGFTDILATRGAKRLQGLEKPHSGAWQGLYPVTALVVLAVSVVLQVLLLSEWGTVGLLGVPVFALWVAFVLLGGGLDVWPWKIQQQYRIYQRARAADPSAPVERAPFRDARHGGRQPALIKTGVIGVVLLAIGIGITLVLTHGSSSPSSTQAVSQSGVGSGGDGTDDDSISSTPATPYASPSDTTSDTSSSESSTSDSSTSGSSTSDSSASGSTAQAGDAPSDIPSPVNVAGCSSGKCETASVLGDDVAIRSTPSTTAEQTGTLNSGQRVDVDCMAQGAAVQTSDGSPDTLWIKLANGGGYVFNQFLGTDDIQPCS